MDWEKQSMSSLHADFQQECDFPKRDDFTLDRDKAKNIISREKGKIMRVIRMYEQSGNGATNASDLYQLGDGEGAITDEETHAKWGHFDPDLAEEKGGNDRAFFLNGQPSDILYWWAVLDDLEILTATGIIFKSEHAAGTTERPVPLAALQKKES